VSKNSLVLPILRMLTLVLLVLASESGTAKPAVLVFFGGFGSCKVGGWPSEIKARGEIDNLADSLRAAGFYDLLDSRSCFAIGNNRVFSEFDDEGAFESSPNELFETIRDAASAHGGPVFLMGHSHGGTMAMLASTWLEDLDVRGLATIDPISMENCSAGGFFTQIFDFGSDAGCRQSPADLVPIYPRIKLAIKDFWLNFYQNQHSLVHSGPIPLASTNTYVGYSYAGNTPTGTHGAIQLDSRVWGAITENVLESALR